MLLQNMPKIQELKKNTIVEARDIKNVIWDELLGILRVHEVYL